MAVMKREKKQEDIVSDLEKESLLGKEGGKQGEN